MDSQCKSFDCVQHDIDRRRERTILAQLIDLGHSKRGASVLLIIPQQSSF